MPLPPAGPCCVAKTQPTVCVFPPITSRWGWKLHSGMQSSGLSSGEQLPGRPDGSVRHDLSEWHALITEKWELGWVWVNAFLRSSHPRTVSWFVLSAYLEKSSLPREHPCWRTCCSSSQLAVEWWPAWPRFTLHHTLRGSLPFLLNLTSLCLHFPDKALLHSSLP